MKKILILGLVLAAVLLFGILKYHCGNHDMADFVIKVMTAIGVISAVMFAAYGKEIETFVSPVSVQLESLSGGDNFKNLSDRRGNGAEHVITYHLVVRNLNPNLPAKTCSVRLIEIWDENATGGFVQKFRFAVPRWMVWAPAEDNPTERTVRDFEIIDLGNLYLSDGEFRLGYSDKQGGVFEGNCKLGTRRKYVFRVTADGMPKSRIFSVCIRPKSVTPSAEWPYSYTLDVKVE